MKSIKRRWVLIYYLLIIGAIIAVAVENYSEGMTGVIVGVSMIIVAQIMVIAKCRCPYCKSAEVTRHLTLDNRGYHCSKCGKEITYESW